MKQTQNYVRSVVNKVQNVCIYDNTENSPFFAWRDASALFILEKDGQERERYVRKLALHQHYTVHTLTQSSLSLFFQLL
jgi:hypothetical protein